MITSLGNQICVCTLFDDPPVIKHYDVVGVSHGLETMGDYHDGLISTELPHVVDDLPLLVEKQGIGIAVDGTRNVDPLPTPAQFQPRLP